MAKHVRTDEASSRYQRLDGLASSVPPDSASIGRELGAVLQDSLHRAAGSGHRRELYARLDTVVVKEPHPKAIISYLVTAYYSVAVLIPDALGVLEDVEIGRS